MLRHSNRMRNNKVKKRKEKILLRKSWLSPSDLKRLEQPGLDLSESFLSFCPQHSSPPWGIFRLRSFRPGHLSDSYSWTTSQPSLLRSAILLTSAYCEWFVVLPAPNYILDWSRQYWFLFGKGGFLVRRSPQTAYCYPWIWIPRRTSLFSTDLLSAFPWFPVEY